MASEVTETDNGAISAQLRGETVAYAVQSAIYNLGANLFEPYVGYLVQKNYSEHNTKHPGYGNYAQNLAGEFAGDILGASTLIAAEALCPEPLHACTRKIRSWVDPLYTSVAHAVFRDKSQPDYEDKVDKWKTFQERNLVRALIVGSAGIAGNIATQKLVAGNPSPASIIFAGKLASQATTTALGLTLRMAFPQQTRNIDSWMSRKIFAPMMEDKELAADELPGPHTVKLVAEEAKKTGQPTIEKS